MQTYDRCEDLVVRGVRVVSRAYWNNDGIDLVDCRRVVVERCDIDSADDGVCLKASAPGGCEDVTVRECRVRSSASAVKFGTASVGGFRRIRVEAIDVRDTFRSAIALEAVDGGTIEDVTVRRIRARNTGNAIFIRLGHRNKSEAISTLRNVLIEDVRVDIPAGKPDAGLAFEGPPTERTNVLPSSIVGLPGHPVENVTLRNIEVTMTGDADHALSVLTEAVPQRERDYPEFSMFGELPAWGLCARDTHGLTLDRIFFRRKGAELRAAVYLDSVQGADLRGLRVSGKSVGPVLSHRGSTDVRPPKGNL